MDNPPDSARMEPVKTRFAIIIVATVATLATARWSAGQSPVPRAMSCDALGGEGADLRCIDLAPTADWPNVQGRIVLEHAASPFGIAVSAAGVPRYDLRAEISGLPTGGEAAFVAWLTDEFLAPVRRLGTVANGVSHLGEVALTRFRVFVSAESDDGVEARSGPLVVRGSSPSTRLQAHDIAFASPLAAYRRQVESADGGDTHAHEGAWSMPPTRFDLTMPPGMMDIRPSVAPWAFGLTDDVPRAKPQSWIRMAHGDTLRLTAEPVRRRLQSRDLLMYGFNGEYPGPLIEVDEASTIVVDFRNHLPAPTAVHWHGIRLENRFDGVPGVTQDPIEPGDRFVYEVRFPDAGLYWYHPHHREDVFQELGLYGNLLVRPDAPAAGVHDREEVLLLDDILIDGIGPNHASGALRHVMGDTGSALGGDSAIATVPFGREHANYALMGRFGNLLLVNGETSWPLEVDQHQIVRLYLTNVSNTRTFNLVLDGAEMQVVGSDVGMFEWMEPVESVVIGPAERYIVDVRYREPGRFALTNSVQALDHINAAFFSSVDTLGTVTVNESSLVSESATRSLGVRVRNHAAAEELRSVRAHADRPVDHTLELTLRSDGLPPVVEQLMRADRMYFPPVDWEGTMPMMNWASSGNEVSWNLRDPATALENMDIDWRFATGDVVKLRLINDRDTFHSMQHPLHIHGQRFVVLTQNGRPNDNLVWKDTVLLPAGSTTDILLELGNPGRWMIHCHIAEHLETGMKMVMRVGD